MPIEMLTKRAELHLEGAPVAARSAEADQREMALLPRPRAHDEQPRGAFRSRDASPGTRRRDAHSSARTLVLSLTTSLSAIVVITRSCEKSASTEQRASGASGASESSMNPGGRASMARLCNAQTTAGPSVDGRNVRSRSCRRTSAGRRPDARRDATSSGAERASADCAAARRVNTLVPTPSERATH